MTKFAATSSAKTTEKWKS